MIRAVHVRNFRCLQDLRVELGGLTAIVGPNGSGKSALLRAMSGFPVWQEPWRKGPADSSTTFHTTHRGDLTIDIQGAAFPSAVLLHPSLDQIRRANVLGPARQLTSDADNLHNLVYALGRAGGAAYADRLRALVPLYGDVDLTAAPPTYGSGYHWLRFRDRWDPKVWYTPDEVSDGTLLVAAYLAAAMMPEPPELLLIEEPERGLHPWLIGELVAVFRALAEPTTGDRPVQVVLATHSADLLRHLEPGEVRFVGRDAETGATRIRTAPEDAEGWPEVLAAYETIGDVWLSGVLGGVPGEDRWAP